MKDCLEEHREDSDFSAECRAEFEKMMEARAADFRLDPTLREVRVAPPQQLQSQERFMIETKDLFTSVTVMSVQSTCCCSCCEAGLLRVKGCVVL